MDPEGQKFGRGPRELSGTADLISRYKLLPYHDFFCKIPLPMSILDTHYLHTVVGDTEIRKGEGMQLDQLIQNPSRNRETNARLQPFELDILNDTFQLRETTPVELPDESKSEAKYKERKHKKRKDRSKEKDKECKKHKHRRTDKVKEKRIEAGIVIVVRITQKGIMKRLEVCYILELLLDMQVGSGVVKVVAAMSMMLCPRTQKTIG